MLVVANADAGSADGLDDALAVLGDVEVVRTSSPDELDPVVRRAELIVVAGGDGSLHAVVEALHRNDRLSAVTLGLVPLGTGNDFARGVGISDDPAEAARLVLDGSPTPVDLFLDDAGGVVVNNAHVGAGAEAAKAARAWKKALGPLGYVVGAAITAVRPPALRLRVTVDGTVVAHRRTLQVAVGNAPYVGGGTSLTPEADPCDGVADVMISSALGPAARAAYALRLRRGEHHHGDNVDYLRGTAVRIEGEAFNVSADGEIQGPFTNRAWTVVPGALTLLLPATS